MEDESLKEDKDTDRDFLSQMTYFLAFETDHIFNTRILARRLSLHTRNDSP